MSRSNPTVENPCTRWFEWNAQEGVVSYWDSEKEERISVELPFSFLPLDILNTIKGWHDPSQSNIYSNEVKNTTHEPLKVKSFNGNVIAEGLYANIKDTVKAAGGKFAASVYCAYRNDEGEMVIGNVMLKGAALSEWIDFKRKKGQRAIETGAVVISGAHKEKNGATEYYVPEFKLVPVTEEGDAIAKELDRYLQHYLENKTDHVFVDQEADDEPTMPEQPAEKSAPPHPVDAGQPPLEDMDIFEDIDDELPF